MEMSLYEKLFASNTFENELEIALSDARRKFLEAQISKYGNLPSFQQFELLAQKPELSEIQREICETYHTNDTYRQIKRGEKELPNIVRERYKKLNRGMLRILPRANDKKDKSFFKDLSALIGYRRSLENRGLFSLDNVVAGIVYTGLAAFGAGFLYANFFLDRSGNAEQIQQAKYHFQFELPAIATLIAGLVAGFLAQTRRSGRAGEEEALAVQDSMKKLGLITPNPRT
jgi:hypothetical protein